MRIGIIALLLIAIVLVSATPSYATGEYLNILCHSYSGNSFSVTFEYNMGTDGDFVWATVSNLDTPGYQSAYFYNLTGSGVQQVTLDLPAVDGDLMEWFILVEPAPLYAEGVSWWYDSAGASSGNCTPTGGGTGGGGGKGNEDAPPPPFVPGVTPIDDPELLAHFMSLPNDEGQLPCGVFDLGSTAPAGWGYKVAYVPDFPACLEYTPDLTILCNQEDGSWTGEYVKDLHLSDDGLEFTWTSEQHGVCGLFPTD